LYRIGSLEASLTDDTRIREVTVSVIVPVFNRANVLSRALRSALAQTFTDFEIVIVDDGSTEDIPAVVAEFADARISIVRHVNNLGPAAARNSGIRAARGTYIAFLDSDDEWLPEKLEHQIEYMRDPQTRCGVSCTAYLLRKEDVAKDREINLGGRDVGRDLIWGCSLSPGSTLIATKTIFEEVGPFDERLMRLEDWDWLLRCANSHEICVLPMSLSIIHSSSSTSNPHHTFEALNILATRQNLYDVCETYLDVMKFRSTMLLEKSAAYYRLNSIHWAIWYGLLCFLACPFRDRAFYTRMLHTLLIRGVASSSENDLKVTFVVQRLELGGTEKHIARIVPALRSRGMDITLFALEQGGNLEQRLRTRGVTIVGPKATEPKFWRRIQSTLLLNNYLRRRRPDIVQFFLPEPYLIGSVASLFTGTKFRIMSRRSLANYQERHRIFALFERWLHRHTNVLLGNSRAVVSQLAQECANYAKIGLIYNGVEISDAIDDTTRVRSRTALGLSRECFTLVMVANLVEYKGHRDLLNALALVRDRLPTGWRLIVVGRDDGIGPALKRQAAELELTHHLIWVGEDPDVDKFFGAADVALLCSHEEGFSNSLLEAMQLGLPTIATAVGGNIDAVVPHQTGLLVPPRDPAALAAAIVYLAENPELRSRFGAAGRRRIEQFFSLASCVERYINLYNGLDRLKNHAVQNIIDASDDQRSATATLRDPVTTQEESLARSNRIA